MAITLISEPITASIPTTTPYRPTYVDCSSDSANIVRVIADVFINNGAAPVTTIEKEPILGTTDQFRIEMGEINKKYLSSEFFNTSVFLETHDCSISADIIDIVIYEVNEVGGLLTTTWAEDGAGTGGQSVNNIYQFNGVNQHQQTMSDRYCDGVTKKFLTNRPQNSKIISSQVYRCGILPLTEGFRSYITVEEFDGLNGTGSSLASNDSVSITATYRKASYTIDPSFFNAATKSIVYHANDNGGSRITEFFTVNVVDTCADDVTLFWQNHWGEFDQYFFAGNQIEKTKNKVKSITNRLNLEYNVSDRGMKDIKRMNSREFEIFTQTESPAVVEWLAEIGESVDVYIIKNSERIPINVKRVTSEIVNDDDVVVQMAVKFTLANERINQLG